jgi:hypothetical protein
MPETKQLSRWRRCLLSLFILLNISTVLYMNLPREWSAEKYQQWTATWDPMTKYRLSLINWRIAQYAFLVGLNNQWQMFSTHGDVNWWYDIRAVYSNGRMSRTVLLPLPTQSERTWSEKNLFDLKEIKFTRNIHNNEFARKAYMLYLAKQYPKHEGLPLTEIHWKLVYQTILPPDEAVKQQKLVLNDERSINYGHYQARPPAKATLAPHKVRR